MKKVRCDKFGNCPLADNAIHEIDDGYVCAYREETGECGMSEGAKSAPLPWMKYASIAAAVVLVMGLGYLVYTLVKGGPRCDIASVSQMLRTDPKLQELETAGTNCLTAGRQRGDSEQMVVGTLALRTAADKGSAAAAFELGRLFDPLERARLDSESKLPQLLPAIDPELALNYYDKAAAGGQAGARELADRLRKSNPVLRLDARGKNGGALSLPNYEGIFQRVIAKPGAVLANAPDPSANGTPIQLFRLMYVFEKKPGWLKVGTVLESGGEGWVRQDQVEPWNVMLAMRYLPQGNRSPALFFNDEIALKSVIGAVDAKDQVDAMIRSADSGSPDPRLAAIEDKSIDWSSSPYVMPVLRTANFTTDDGRNVQLAQVGSISGLGTSTSKTTGAVCTEKSAQDLIHQVVFVIDTTESMGTYIAGVRRIAETWRDQVQRAGIENQVRFGVVGFRNNMNEEPQRSRLEYVHKVILSPSTGNADAFVAEMTKVKPATVSTRTFDEDPVAGLRDALDFDWSQGCGVRQIFLITDAGALTSDDPLSAYPGTGLSSIAAEAREKGITIYPVHLLTPAARQAGDIDGAATMYKRDLYEGTGENRYVAIPNGSPAGFDGYLSKIGTLIQNANRIVARASQTAPSGPRDVKDMVMSDIFAVQQRFLGASARAQVPTFAASWTSDRDIANLDRASLEVCVFLTRRQLSQLAETVQRLINNAKQKNVSAGDFFGMLRMVSAATAQDPQRFGGRATTMGALMPSFLSLLPYKSEVLSLDEQDWRSMGATKQDAFIRRLSEKLTFYRSLDAIEGKWQSFQSSDRANDVALIPLSRMP